MPKDKQCSAKLGINKETVKVRDMGRLVVCEFLDRCDGLDW